MPSRKVLSVFIVVVALVSSIIIAFGRDKSSTAINYASNLVAGDKIDIPENPNWKSELGKVGVDTQAIEAATSTENETSTDIVSRTLVSNYLALKDSDKLDSSSAQKLIDQTLQYIGQTDSQAQTIKASQLNIVADNGRVSMAQYGDNLGNILKKYKTEQTKNELEIMSTAINSNDQAKLSELYEVVANYGEIEADLLKMPVPQTFTKVHLEIINRIEGIISSLKEIQNVFADPIKGLAALQAYKENASVFVSAIQAVNQYISKNNIVYKQGSGGYYLSHGI